VFITPETGSVQPDDIIDDTIKILNFVHKWIVDLEIVISGANGVPVRAGVQRRDEGGRVRHTLSSSAACAANIRAPAAAAAAVCSMLAPRLQHHAMFSPHVTFVCARRNKRCSFSPQYPCSYRAQCAENIAW